MITSDQLLAAGYQKHSVHHKQYATCLYQKRFDDKNGKRYFIRFYEYDNRQSKRLRGDHFTADFTYSSDAQFKDGYGNTFNVECLTNDSIEQVEEFFERVWKHIPCNYYELF